MKYSTRRQNKRRTNIWQCDKCHAHNIISTLLQTGGKHEVFQAKCKECGKISRLASSWGTHIRASWPVTKRYKAIECLRILNTMKEPDYVEVCGRKPVQMAQQLYGGPKVNLRRWRWGE